MYSPIFRRSGRDSIRVRFTPAKANTARHETSQPGEPEPAPQKISIVFAGPSSGAGGRVLGPGEPPEPRRVAGVVLAVLGERHRAVVPGGEPRPDRGARARRLLGDDRAPPRRSTPPGTTAARGRCSAIQPLHWPSACGCDSTIVTSSSASSLPGGEAVGHRLDDLADERHVGRLQREAVEHRVHAALERVLDRHQRPLDPAAPARRARRRAAWRAARPRRPARSASRPRR